MKPVQETKPVSAPSEHAEGLNPKQFIARIISQVPFEAKSILDVGVERGEVGALCRLYRPSSRIVGIEVWQPYIDALAGMRVYDEIIRQDVCAGNLPFTKKEFDVAICLELLEHVTKDCGRRLIQELKRVAKQVVLTTPNGFQAQSEVDGNPFQRHITGWTARELKDQGFKVKGFGDFKIRGRWIRRPYDLSYLMQGFSLIMASRATTLIATYHD